MFFSSLFSRPTCSNYSEVKESLLFCLEMIKSASISLFVVVAAAILSSSFGQITPASIGCSCAFKEDGLVYITANIKNIDAPLSGNRNWIIVSAPGASCEQFSATAVPPSLSLFSSTTSIYYFLIYFFK